MSKTNIYVLIATALLGVLLLFVRQIGRNTSTTMPEPATSTHAQAPGEDSPRIEPRPKPTAENQAPSLTRVGSREDLRGLLLDRGLDADRMLDASAAWYRARGQIDQSELLSSGQPASASAYFESLNEETLNAMSRSGDSRATLALGLRRTMDDSFAAMELFGLATSQGSAYALLQIASQLETFSDVAASDFAADPEFSRNLESLSRGGSNGLLNDAFAYAAAAVRDAGEPILNDELSDWLQTLATRLPDAALNQACEQSFSIYLALGKQRRKRGMAPLNFTPPPVFLSNADWEESQPCGESASPIVSTLDLSNCTSERVLNADSRASLLYICP